MRYFRPSIQSFPYIHPFIHPALTFLSIYSCNLSFAFQNRPFIHPVLLLSYSAQSVPFVQHCCSKWVCSILSYVYICDGDLKSPSSMCFNPCAWRAENPPRNFCENAPNIVLIKLVYSPPSPSFHLYFFLLSIACWNCRIVIIVHLFCRQPSLSSWLPCITGINSFNNFQLAEAEAKGTRPYGTQLFPFRSVLPYFYKYRK